jgi:cytochrome c-type protein NapB
MRGDVQLIVLAVFLLVVAGVAQGAPPDGEPIPDRELGLSSGSVFDVPSPDPVSENRTDPGEKPALPRAYPGAPAIIPHGVADVLPITREDNLCLACHLVKEKVKGEPTPIPESHFIDLRNSPEKIGKQLVGARYNCISCHASLTEADPLVGNRFPNPSVGPTRVPKP